MGPTELWVVCVAVLALVLVILYVAWFGEEPAAADGDGPQAAPEPVPYSMTRQKMTEDGGLEGTGSDRRDCAICLAQYAVGDMLGFLNPCNHIFHADCVDPWLRTGAPCPLCRTAPEAPTVETV